MTSLKSTTGWDANKQTGNNYSSHGRIQKHGTAVGASQQSAAAKSSGKSRAVNGTPATSTPHFSTSSSTTGSSRPGSTELSSSSPLDSELDVMRQRELFYKENYDYMTGVRIASTLGGFFMIVLLTLLYKSKCKGKHSREPSTLTLNSIPYPAPIHPAHLTLMRGQNIQVNGRHLRHHQHHDFGGGGPGGGGGGGSPGANAAAITQLLDSSCYGYMNQVHPANSHQPVFSNFANNNHAGTGAHPKNPAVLLITAANSESSDEEEELSELASGGCWPPQAGVPEEPPPQLDRRVRGRNPLGPMPPCRQVLGEHQRHPAMQHLGSGGKGNIDINVILPTPSISPSGSENFNLAAAGQYFGGATPGGSLFPSGRGGSSLGASVAGGTGGRGRLVVSRSLSSDNENDQSEISVGGGDVSECSSGSDAAAAMALAFGAASSSLFSLDNLKFVDDTSSENIPTRASDQEDGDERDDTRSIGSDSVFACFDHNFDHIAPTYARRVSSGVLMVHSSGEASPIPRRHHHHPCRHCSPHESIAPLLPLTSSPNLAPAPIPPPHTLPEPGASSSNIRAASSSGFCEVTSDEPSDFRVTLTQAHAQVHHRDSFCSDLESVNDYMETGARRRRSSSTQTTLSDLRQALGYSPAMMGWSTATQAENNGGATSPGTISLTSTHHFIGSGGRRLSVPRRRRSLSPHLSQGVCGHLALSPRNSSASTSPPQFKLHRPSPPQPPRSLPLEKVTCAEAATSTEQTPTNPPPPPTVLVSPSSPFIPPKINRKRSFDAVRKTLSLQCEDKPDVASLFAVSSSNETTPTN